MMASTYQRIATGFLRVFLNFRLDKRRACFEAAAFQDEVLSECHQKLTDPVKRSAGASRRTRDAHAAPN
jgi:hypothetical protein